MRHMRLLPALIVVAAIVFALHARAEEPLHYTFAPAPPGGVVQSQLVYLSGEAMHSQWRAVASKKLAGSAHGQSFDQWYLSIYSIDDTTYKLRYQTPTNGGPLSKVTKANGADMWFPLQTLKIVGTAELMQPSVQQLVVQSHETGADCGESTVTIFGTSGGKVVPAVSVRNGCDLSASVVHSSNGDTIVLSGPYYNASAPMCCPTKPHASAVLSYTNGKWVEKPNYYSFYPGKFPPE